MKPREMKKASTMSQITTSENPLSASAMGSVPLRAVMAMPRAAMAPMGIGLRMMPTMVAMKIARRCRPLSQSARRLASRAAAARVSAAAWGWVAATAAEPAVRGAEATAWTAAAMPLKRRALGIEVSRGRPR